MSLEPVVFNHQLIKFNILLMADKPEAGAVMYHQSRQYKDLVEVDGLGHDVHGNPISAFC